MFIIYKYIEKMNKLKLNFFKIEMCSFSDLNLNVTHLNENSIDQLVEHAIKCKLAFFLLRTSSLKIN